MSEGGRSRRAKQKVNYAKEQEFSDAEDIFEDSDKDEPVLKRGRPRSRKSTDGVVMVHTGEVDQHGIYVPPKPIYTEKGYDPSLLPIRERFPFMPEYEADGSPRIDLIVGRRPVDEHESNDNANGNDNEQEEEENEEEEEEEEDSDTTGGRRGRRRSKKVQQSSPQKEQQSGPVEYEYLVKYKNRSYLHLEWKTGADLESMNKSAKSLYRRYLRKVATGNDEELEDPNFDPSYAEPQKICAKAEQEITLELTDKEMLEWEKEREKELAEVDSESENEEEDEAESQNANMKDVAEEKKEEESKKEEEDVEDWNENEDIDFSQLTLEKLRRIVEKDGPYYPKIDGCDNPYRDGYITEPPKKPRASYIFFQCTMRSYFAKRNPKATQGELMTIVGEQWNSMTEAEQEPFIELAREEVKEYEKERALMEKAQKPNEMWQPTRRCLMVLDRLAKDGFSKIFLQRVDLEEFPDYEEFVDQPMDLGTIRVKLHSKKYQAPEQFARDMRKVWNNCKIYNRHGSAIWHVADYMSKQFERLYHAWVLDFRERYLRWTQPRARPWESTCREHDGKCGTPDEDLLLCDHCDAMYGYKCLKLKKPPTGQWHCPDCKPKSTKFVRGMGMMSAIAEHAARKRAELGDTPKRTVKQNMYLLKWVGLGYEFCTWETKEDVGSPSLIAEYKKLNNPSVDESDMPEAVAQKVLDDIEHVNSKNAGGTKCIPELRSQLYAQTRAFQFCKFGMSLPHQLCTECGPKTKATTESPEYPRDVVECLNEMTYKLSQKDAYAQLTEFSKKLPPLLTGEYDTIIPITSKGLMMNVGELTGCVAFLGYRQFPDGAKGPAELNKLVRGVGDKIIAVDGVSTINKSFKEVISLLRESGKNEFALMRFLESKYTSCDENLASLGNMGRYSTEELREKFSSDRNNLLVHRTQAVPEEEDGKVEKIDPEAEEGDSDEDSEASEGSFLDSEDEKDEEGMVMERNPTLQEGGIPSKKNSDVDMGEESDKDKASSGPVESADGGATPEAVPEEDVLRIRAETTQSLASRLLDVDIGYSSDEGGDEDYAYYLDGVDSTFTALRDIPEDIVETTEKSKPKGVKDDSLTLPVKKNEFSTLGDRGKLVAAVSLTSKPPDSDDFDNFPEASTKSIEAQKAKEREAAGDPMDTDAPEKAAKRSTVKVEQISTDTNEVINVWANVEAAAATLQIPLNEMRQVLRGEYDEELGDEIGSFRWRYALAGAVVTAGKSESKGKGSKKGKEAWLQFRDRLYDPSEPHIYKNGNRLRDYQVEGVNWLASTYYKKHGCILADEMGLGKTVQIICYLEHLSRVEKIRRPFLVVVPLSTVEHWRREFEGWTDMICCIYHDRQRVWRDVLREYEWYYEDRPHTADYLKFDVLVTTYDTLIGDFDVISQIPFRAAIVDEAHRLRNQKGKLLECMKEISAKGTLQYGFQSRVLMSGTPLQNDLNELWTLLNFIEPFKFADLEEFQALYGNMSSKEQVEGLQNKISPFMLRRVKEDVAKDIPAKEETVIDVELTSIQKQYYRAIFEHNHAFLNMGSSRSTAPKLMNIQMELRKVCNHPCLLDGVEHREQDRNFKELMEQGEFEGKTPEVQQQMINEQLYVMTSGKMVLLDKLLPKLRKEGHKILIFSQMVRMLDLISEYCDFRKYPYERLDGRVRGAERQKSIDRFEREPDSFLFLLSTRAGGVGINLTAADVCIIFDSDWNPQNDVQAQARCHRIGQTKDVRIYRLITSRTFEQEMFDRASKKLGLEQAVLGTFDQMDDDIKPTSKEMEQLLKKGAYALLEDGNDEITKSFCADDIDSILAKRTRTRVVEGTKTASWLNKSGMVVSKSKFSADSKTAGLDMDDPLFWQKVMPDFVTPQIMLQKLEDLSDEVFGTSGKKKKGKGRGRGRWKRKKEEEANETNEAEKDSLEQNEGDEAGKDQQSGKAGIYAAPDDNEKDEGDEKEPEDTEADNKASEKDEEDKEEEPEDKFQMTRTDIRKVAKFISDLKSMMEGVFDEADDDALPAEGKAVAQKLLLTISVKEKLFNEEQRHLARSMLKRLEGNRRRRCRTSDVPDRPSPMKQETGDNEIREELRIVKKRKKRRKKGEEPDIDVDIDIGEDGYKVHSDDEAEWSDVAEDLYEGGGKKKNMISRKEANRRRQWAADADTATAAGRTWPVFPRTMVAKVLGNLLDEVIKHDEANGGVFSVPVSKEDFPEYYEEVKQPMDYGTMRKKLENGEYRSAQAMQKDFIGVMQNCLKFNANDSDIVQEARQQALMRPNLLRAAALKHDLFLAEDGSVFEITDDDKKDKKNKDGSPKKRRRRKKKGEDIDGDETSDGKPTRKKKGKKKGEDIDGDETSDSKPTRKKKGKKSAEASEAEDSGAEDSDDAPLSSMKPKKKKKGPRIKISLADADGGTKKKSKKRARTEEEDEDFEEDAVDTPIPKKRGRKSKAQNAEGETPKRKGRKSKGGAQDDEVMEDTEEAKQSGNASDDGDEVFLDAAAWKKGRESLGDSFEEARNHFSKEGPWKFPSPLKPSNFKDVALATVSKLSKIDRYSIFAEAVDEEEAPGYYEVVRDPIDLLAMKAKVESGTYGTGSKAAKRLYEDFLLMFENCALYNDDEGEVIEEATRVFGLLPETFAAACKSVLKKQPKGRGKG